ncbi:hypothetical protein HU200_047978 [Digitaria exilis]|uniref:Uncharacterized protein n=1 Tax=Digitaria exilis TaxID=1010633 RepID=A0A835EDF3_9POAL|nr:hypothetical protein HU200_047978 [Digitaria exilis]
MPTHVVVVCSVVGFLGLLVVVLGVAGEAATSQALVQNPVETDYFITDSNKCVYQTTPALACGIVAALLALTAQVAVTAISFFRGCCPTWELPKETRRIVGVALSASSWILVIIVVSLFITGAAMNSDDKKRDRSTDGDCPVDPGSAMFAAATVLSLVATGLQIASYVLLATQEGSTKPQPAEVAMGQPIVQHQAPRNDAEEEIAGGDPPLPPSAPPLSEAAENNSTSQV